MLDVLINNPKEQATPATQSNGLAHECFYSCFHAQSDLAETCSPDTAVKAYHTALPYRERGCEGLRIPVSRTMTSLVPATMATAQGCLEAEPRQVLLAGFLSGAVGLAGILREADDSQATRGLGLHQFTGTCGGRPLGYIWFLFSELH